MPSRAHTPSPPPPKHRGAASTGEADEEDPTEVTTLLPSSSSRLPSSSSRPHTPKLYNGKVHSGHARKTSVSGSVSERRVGPAEQVARVSKKGQRRILTTPFLIFLFFLLTFLTFLDVTLTILLALNTAYDLSAVLVWTPYRGSGFLEVWVGLLGAWAGAGGMIFFSHPPILLFLTNALTLILLLPLLLLTLLSPPLRSAHYPLLFLPLSLTALTYLTALLASHLVRRARQLEGQRVVRMIAARQAEEAGHGGGTRAERERRAEEEVARALVGMEGGRWWVSRVGNFLKNVGGFLGGLAGLTVVVLLLANLSLTAYDNATPLPSSHSKLISVHPPSSPWSYKLHLLCADPPKNGTPEADPDHPMIQTFPSDHKSPHNKTTLPTIIYFSPSGVPGTLSHLPPARVPSSTNPFPIPRPPNNGTDISGGSPYPGAWIWSLQKSGKVGRVCAWDRGGYGFSEVGGVELGQAVDGLWEALGKAGEKGEYLLVGDGYGGLLARVFAAKHPKSVHSILHIDSQTAQSYFKFPPTYNLLTLTLHRFFTRLIPSLASPLGLHRFYSLFSQYDTSLARIYASARPGKSSVALSENMRKTLLTETYLSHTHDSPSFKTLLKSQPPRYPSDIPAIILSSDLKMKADPSWAEGQRSLAEEVTSEKGRRRWEIIRKVGHDVCAVDSGPDGDGRGRRECTRSLVELIGI